MVVPVRKLACSLRLLGALLVIGGCAAPGTDVVDLEFLQPPAAGSDEARTLDSLVKVQGTGQFREDGLYLITQYGDRRELFEQENQRAIDHPMLYETWRHCSVFTAKTGGSVLMGRNWDNQNVGSVIVSLYRPEGGYASISFSRTIDIGFGHKDLAEQKGGPFEGRLLLAPFYAMDGVNENGLAVAVAANDQTAVEPDPARPPRFVTYVIRTMLDQARTVDEAVALAERLTPFDIEQRTLVSHLLVADPSGRSVVLEYSNDHWQVTPGDGQRQVMTTQQVAGVADADLRQKCWRYRGLSESLDTAAGSLGWRDGMRMLRDVAQKGTTWSVAYGLSDGQLHFSVYQDWDTVYRLAMP